MFLSFVTSPQKIRQITSKVQCWKCEFHANCLAKQDYQTWRSVFNLHTTRYLGCSRLVANWFTPRLLPLLRRKWNKCLKKPLALILKQWIVLFDFCWGDWFKQWSWTTLSSGKPPDLDPQLKHFTASWFVNNHVYSSRTKGEVVLFKEELNGIECQLGFSTLWQW